MELVSIYEVQPVRPMADQEYQVLCLLAVSFFHLDLVHCEVCLVEQLLDLPHLVSQGEDRLNQQLNLGQLD
jgi:hypothetical protein